MCDLSDRFGIPSRWKIQQTTYFTMVSYMLIKWTLTLDNDSTSVVTNRPDLRD